MSTYQDQPNAGGQTPSGVPPQATPPPPPPLPPYGVDPRTAAPGWNNRWFAARDSRHKSVALAYVLSFIMPGLGQVYLGYYQRGFMHAIIFATTIALLAGNAVRHLEPLFGIFLGFFILYNVIDAGRRAAFYNQALDGMREADLPKDFKMPSGGGSLVGGVLLTAFGLLLFLNTRYDISLEWLADWWPLGLVALGLYLIYKAVRTRQKNA